MVSYFTNYFKKLWNARSRLYRWFVLCRILTLFSSNSCITFKTNFRKIYKKNGPIKKSARYYYARGVQGRHLGGGGRGMPGGRREREEEALLGKNTFTTTFTLLLNIFFNSRLYGRGVPFFLPFFGRDTFDIQSGKLMSKSCSTCRLATGKLPSFEAYSN